MARALAAVGFLLILSVCCDSRANTEDPASESSVIKVHEKAKTRCPWYIRLANLIPDVMLWHHKGRVLRAAQRHLPEEEPNPFVFTPDYSLSRRSGTGPYLALVDINTGISMTISDGVLHARFHECGGNNSARDDEDRAAHRVQFEFPLSYTALSRLETVEGAYRSPSFAYRFITQYLEHSIVGGPMLAGTYERLAGFFYRKAKEIGERGFHGLAVFPTGLVEDGMHHGPYAGIHGPYAGIQLEGTLSLPSLGDRHVVMQAVIRHGSLQIWYSDELTTRYDIFPLSWAFEADDTISEDLLQKIYDQAMGMANRQGGKTYVFHKDGRRYDMSVSAISFANRLGLEVTPTGVAHTDYIGKGVIVTEGEHRDKLGRVLGVGRPTLAPNGALRVELVVENEIGERMQVDSRDVAILENARLRRFIHPIYGGAIDFLHGTVLVSLETGKRYRVESVKERYPLEGGGTRAWLSLRSVTDGEQIQADSASESLVPAEFYLPPKR